MARFASDDINKLLWMVRITSGVYPRIQQSDFLDPRGQVEATQQKPGAEKVHRNISELVTGGCGGCFLYFTVHSGPGRT